MSVEILCTTGDVTFYPDMYNNWKRSISNVTVSRILQDALVKFIPLLTYNLDDTHAKIVVFFNDLLYRFLLDVSGTGSFFLNSLQIISNNG